MKVLLAALFLFSCSHHERKISSVEDHQTRLRALYEASPTEPLLDRHEFQRRKTDNHYICKQRGIASHVLATEPVGVSANFSVKNRYEGCKLISRAEYRNHQN